MLGRGESREPESDLIMRQLLAEHSQGDVSKRQGSSYNKRATSQIKQKSIMASFMLGRSLNGMLM